MEEAEIMARKKRIKACDHGHETIGSVRRLDTGGGSGLFLCRKHWYSEMRWRKMRNKKLMRSARFSIRKFPADKPRKKRRR